MDGSNAIDNKNRYRRAQPSENRLFFVPQGSDRPCYELKPRIKLYVIHCIKPSCSKLLLGRGSAAHRSQLVHQVHLCPPEYLHTDASSSGNQGITWPTDTAQRRLSFHFIHHSFTIMTKHVSTTPLWHHQSQGMHVNVLSTDQTGPIPQQNEDLFCCVRISGSCFMPKCVCPCLCLIIWCVSELF